MLGKILLAAFLAVDTTEEAFHLYLARKLHDSVNHSLGTRGASGYIHIDRHYILDAAGHMVRLPERAAGDCTATARNHILRLCKLVIQTTEHRRHAVHNRTCDHDEVGLAGR